MPHIRRHRAAGTAHRTLTDSDAYYAENMDPRNYGWYECRTCVAAARPVHPAWRGRDLVLLPASDRAGSITRADFTIDGGLVPTW